MRIGVIPETPLEWLALRLGRIPTPLVDTQLMVVLARAVITAARVGAFEALSAGPLTPPEVAARCGTHPEATTRLLHALVGAGYLRPVGAAQVALTANSRRFLTRASPLEVVDKVIFALDEWRVTEGTETFVREGHMVNMHALLDLGGGEGAAQTPGANAAAAVTPGASDAAAAAWQRYQRGLRAVAGVSAREVAWRTPIPRGATRMLDIGGAHGRFAAAIVRRHPGLHGEILELPQAIAASAELLAQEGLGARLAHRAGDALRDDLGQGVFDAVFASQFNHHLTESQNRDLTARVARALKPGGLLIIQDVARPANPREARRARLGALLDLYFGVASGAGTYSVQEIQAWQTAAGLQPLQTRWLQTLPGLVQVVARKG